MNKAPIRNGYICPECEKGRVRAMRFQNYHTKFKGYSFVVPGCQKTRFKKKRRECHSAVSVSLRTSRMLYYFLHQIKLDG